MPQRAVRVRISVHPCSQRPQNYMQLLHRSSMAVKFSRTQPSSSPLLLEHTFIMRLRLALLSLCLKWPQYA